MAGKFTADTGALATAANKIRSFAQEYESIGNQLMQAATTIDYAYKSADHDVYVTSIQSCCKDLKAMVNKLNVIAQVVEQQGKNYDDISAHNVTVAKQLAN